MSSAVGDGEEFGPAASQVPFERGTDGPRVILVGVDGTVTSMRAAAYAGGLARRQGARLAVVFVAAPSAWSAVAMSPVAGAQEEAFQALAGDLRREVRRGAEEFGVPVTFLCRRGDPYAQLARTADELRADMVVVGASAQAGHRLVGSVATRLVRAGRWPVVVVP